MMNAFPEIRGKLGFGCMRMPMKDNEVDDAAFCAMVDRYMSAGFNYFDTAKGYLNGKSEGALRRCLTSRYPRESYILTDKLTNSYFKTEQDIRPLFETQLRECGVEYFDFYLMHSQTRELYSHFINNRAYETALSLKDEGKIRHFGISFHDTPEFLEQILNEWPQIEVVQIQLNYIDYEDRSVRAKELAEVCARYGKPILVMEPVKGGHLANLPREAKRILNSLQGGSPASYALRFAADCGGVRIVLSGMGDMEQVEDNIRTLSDLRPLSAEEREVIGRVCAILHNADSIPCTGCGYCLAGCPKGISIPGIFACVNAKRIFNDWSQDFYYDTVQTAPGRRASDCVGCGACEAACPQHLNVRSLLKSAARLFEKQE